MKMEETNGKVYCSECRFYRYEYSGRGLIECECRKEKVLRDENDPIHRP